MQKCNTIRRSNNKALNAGHSKFCVNHFFIIKQNFLLFCKTECDSNLSKCACLYHKLNNIPQFSLNKQSISIQRGHIINSSSLYVSASNSKNKYARSFANRHIYTCHLQVIFLINVQSYIIKFMEHTLTNYHVNIL